MRAYDLLCHLQDAARIRMLRISHFCTISAVLSRFGLWVLLVLLLIGLGLVFLLSLPL